MKRILIAVLMILGCASQSWAFGSAIQAVLATGYVASDPCAGFVICEGFEGTGTPTNWTTSGSTFNFDATTTPIDGSQYATADYNTSSGYISIPISPAMTDVYMGFKLRVRNLPTSSNDIFEFRGASSYSSYITLRSTGTVQASTSGGAGGSITAAISANTTVFIKLYHHVGSSVDTSLTIWTSPDGTTWTQKSTSTNGNNYQQIAYMRFYTDIGNNYDIDTVKIKATDFNM